MTSAWWLCKWGRSGQAKSRDTGPFSSRWTSQGQTNHGPMHCGFVGRLKEGGDNADYWNMDCHLSGGKGARAFWLKQFYLHIVGLAKTNCTICGSNVLKRGWTGGGLFLVSKYLPVCWSSFWWVKGYETVVSLHLWVRERVLTVSAYAPTTEYPSWQSW